MSAPVNQTDSTAPPPADGLTYQDALVAAGVDPRARGEALDIAAFARIAEHGPRRAAEVSA